MIISWEGETKHYATGTCSTREDAMRTIIDQKLDIVWFPVTREFAINTIALLEKDPHSDQYFVDCDINNSLIDCIKDVESNCRRTSMVLAGQENTNVTQPIPVVSLMYTKTVCRLYIDKGAKQLSLSYQAGMLANHKRRFFQLNPVQNEQGLLCRDGMVVSKDSSYTNPPGARTQTITKKTQICSPWKARPSATPPTDKKTLRAD